MYLEYISKCNSDKVEHKYINCNENNFDTIFNFIELSNSLDKNNKILIDYSKYLKQQSDTCFFCYIYFFYNIFIL